jgi:hypothetical protein
VNGAHSADTKTHLQLVAWKKILEFLTKWQYLLQDKQATTDNERGWGTEKMYSV